MWDVEGRRQITQFRAEDSTYFEWCPDGMHLLTATTAPRLRVNNGYKVWTLTGKMVYEVKCDAEQVWEVMWQGVPEGTFTAPKVKAVPTIQQAAATRYVPPAMRGRPDAQQFKSRMRDDDEPASNVGAQQPDTNTEPKSKSAIKNIKKRDAKKRQQAEGSTTTAPARRTVQATYSPPAAAPSAPASLYSPEHEKKIRNLTKKLQQIEKLKEKQRLGNVMEKNQLEKMETEPALLQELEDLQL